MAQNSIKNIIIGIIALNLVVIIHEFGHFAACKLFGVKVNTFSIGFPPVIASTKIGDTTYQLGALPLGGFVSPDPQGVQKLPYIKKMIMVLAGIFMNFLLAFLILFALARRTNRKPIPVIDTVLPDSPAAHAGLQPGDRFIAINSIPFDQENITELLQTIYNSGGKQVTFIIERDGRELTVPVHITNHNPLLGDGVGTVGVSFQTEKVPTPTLWESITHTRKSFSALFASMGPTVAKMLRSKGKNNGGVIGPIGIMSLLGKSLSYGLATFLYFMAIISFNIGAFNLLPIPFLDGGVAAQYTLEALTGTHLPPAIVTIIYIIFIMLLVFMMIRLTVGDVRQLRRKS
ncbi:MAG: RIP metalloprotease [Candidatus Babeliales bacterium]